LLKPVIHHLEINTVNQVSAADVMKSSAAQKNEVISYMQAYRAIQDTKKEKAVSNQESFQLVHPFLETFLDCNKESVVVCDNDDESSEWFHDRSLPPRFGILNSNMAESTNSMFEGARNGTWLDTIETILKICASKYRRYEKKAKVKRELLQQQPHYFVNVGRPVPDFK
jgi:hypothetical protein